MVRVSTAPKKGLSFEVNFGQFMASLLVFGIFFVLPIYVHAILTGQVEEGNVAGVYTESFVEAQSQLTEIRSDFDWNEFWVGLNSKSVTPLQVAIFIVSSVSIALLISSMIRFYRTLRLLGVEGS